MLEFAVYREPQSRSARSGFFTMEASTKNSLGDY